MQSDQIIRLLTAKKLGLQPDLHQAHGLHLDTRDVSIWPPSYYLCPSGGPCDDSLQQSDHGPCSGLLTPSDPWTCHLLAKTSLLAEQEGTSPDHRSLSRQSTYKSTSTYKSESEVTTQKNSNIKNQQAVSASGSFPQPGSSRATTTISLSIIVCHPAYGEQFVNNLRPLCMPSDSASESIHTQALGHT